MSDLDAPSSFDGAMEEVEIQVGLEKLVRHLKRLQSVTPEAVLSGPFGASMEGPNHDVVVMTAGLPDTEPLPTEIGIGSLERLLGVLACLQGDQIEVTVPTGALVCAGQDRRVRVRIEEPDLILSRLESPYRQH